MEFVNLVYNGIKTDYVINKEGMIYHTNGEFTKKTWDSNLGYRSVISVNDKIMYISVARAILESFIGTPDFYKGQAAIFKDGDKRNLHLDNLEWQTIHYRNKSRLYPVDRTTIEKALNILSQPHGELNTAIKVSGLSEKMIKEILFLPKYRAIRSGYDIVACRSKLSIRVIV